MSGMASHVHEQPQGGNWVRPTFQLWPSAGLGTRQGEEGNDGAFQPLPAPQAPQWNPQPSTSRSVGGKTESWQNRSLDTRGEVTQPAVTRN